MIDPGTFSTLPVVLANGAWSPIAGPMLVYLSLVCSVVWLILLLPLGGIGVAVARKKLARGERATASLVFAVGFTVSSGLGVLLMALALVAEADMGKEGEFPVGASLLTAALSVGALAFSVFWWRSARGAGGGSGAAIRGPRVEPGPT